MDAILTSIFHGFWSILGGKLGGKPEPRSTQKGIEKRCKKEEQRDCQTSRNKNLQPRATARVLGPGEVPPFKAGQSLVLSWLPEFGTPWPLLASKVL